MKTPQPEPPRFKDIRIAIAEAERFIARAKKCLAAPQEELPPTERVLCSCAKKETPVEPLAELATL